MGCGLSTNKKQRKSQFTPKRQQTHRDKKITYIFVQKKLLLILETIFDFFDYEECLKFSNLNLNVFNYIKTRFHTKNLREIKSKYLNILNQHTVTSINIESCIKDIVNKECIQIETVFRHLAYYTYKYYLNRNKMTISDQNSVSLLPTALKYLPPVNTNNEINEIIIKNNDLGVSNINNFISIFIGVKNKLTRNIRKLTLENNKLNDSCLELINDYIQSSKTLEMINLSNNQLGSTSNAFLFLQNLENSSSITTVRCNKCLFNSFSIDYIKRIYYSNNTAIHTFVMQDNLFNLQDMKILFSDFKSRFPRNFFFSFKHSPNYFLYDVTGISFERSYPNEYKIEIPANYYDLFIHDLIYERIRLVAFIRLPDYEYVPERIMQNPYITQLSINLDLVSEHIRTHVSSLLLTDKFKRIVIFESITYHKTNFLADFLSNIINCKNLKVLWFEEIISDGDWVHFVIDILSKNHLEELHFVDCDKFHNRDLCALASYLQSNSSLKKLILSNCNYNDSGAEFLLTKISNHSSLIEIQLNKSINPQLGIKFEDICSRNRRNSGIYK